MPLESEMRKELKVKILKKSYLFYVIVACRLKLCTKRVQRYSTRGKKKKNYYLSKNAFTIVKRNKKRGKLKKTYPKGWLMVVKRVNTF